MNTEYFMKVFDDKTLRNYLLDVCKSFTRNKHIQEDLLQEAWLRISQCDEHRTTRFYMTEGFKAIDNAYHIEWRGWRLERWGKEHRAQNERVRYAEKKYKFVLKKKPETRHGRV